MVRLRYFIEQTDDPRERKIAEEQLFQIQKDPACIDNLAGNPEYAAVIKRLRKIMESDLTAQQDPRVLGQGDVFDTYKYMGQSKKRNRVT